MEISGLGSYLATEEMTRSDNRSLTERLADTVSKNKSGDSVSISNEAMALLQKADEEKQGGSGSGEGKGLGGSASGSGSSEESSTIEDLEKQLEKIMQQIAATASGEPSDAREAKIQALQAQAGQISAQIAQLKAAKLS